MRIRAFWLMAALLIGLAVSGTSHAQVVNMLTNGGFETGVIGPYGTYANNGGTCTPAVVTDCVGAVVPEGPIEGKYCLHLTVSAIGTNNWDIGMTNGGHTWQKGKKYTFSAFMKTKSGTLQVRMKPELGADPWTAYNEIIAEVTDTWQEFHTTTPVFASDTTPCSPTFHIGFAAGDFWMDGIRLYEGDYVEPDFLKNFSAKDPSPDDSAIDVAREAILSWTAGPFAATHDVYLGDSFDDVNDAGAASPLLVSKGQTGTTFDPEGLPEFNKTYYWRVDEVNAPSAPATFKGDVWSFTTEPYAYTVTGVTATASSAATNLGPEKTVNGSGLANGLHSSTDTDMWLTGDKQPLPAWIQYNLNGVYKLVDMTVWNSNQKIEMFIGFGAKSVVIEYSVDGETWSTLNTVEIPQAPSADGYAGSVVDLAGIEAKFVRLTIQSNWGGAYPQVGLSEVRFKYIPVTARAPQPAAGSDGASLEPMLSWRPGREAVSHEVYLSGDRQAVVDGTALAGTTTENRYQAGDLEYGKTYYWKVNEVGDSSVREGSVWNFSTMESFVVDDFEGYDDDDNCVFDTWVDDYARQSNGSVVGYMDSANGTFNETVITNSGRQSMPMDYDNTVSPYLSEAICTFDAAQDWTVKGVQDLILSVRGYPSLGSVAVTETGGKMMLTGAGEDIWNNSDQFTYAFKSLNGDGSMTARVVSNGTGTNEWAKGGVMIRDSLEGGSAHVSMVITGGGGNGASLQFREMTDGASASYDAASAITPPYLVRVERVGDSLTGSVSSDGKTWTSMGTVYVAMESPVYIGLCVTSHVAGTDRTYQFESISTTGAVSGSWQGVVISSPLHNSVQPLYVTLEDSSGKKATQSHATAVTSGNWTEIRMPLSDFAGVNASKVKKLTIGVGDKSNPAAGGSGRIYVDDIRVGRRGASDPGMGLAYYALEDAVTDGSGNGHDGTAVGDPVFVDGPAGLGKALQFDGAGGQRVTIGTWNPSAATGQLSLSLWAKWGGLTTFYQGLIGKRDNWAANDMMWQIEANVTTGVLRLQREGAEVVGPTIPVGEWTHIAGTFDGAAAKMYVNGSVVGQGAFTFGTDPGAMMVFGDSVGGGGNPFNGVLDDVRIYDRTLSSFEINYLAGIE